VFVFVGQTLTNLSTHNKILRQTPPQVYALTSVCPHDQSATFLFADFSGRLPIAKDVMSEIQRRSISRYLCSIFRSRNEPAFVGAGRQAAALQTEWVCVCHPVISEKSKDRLSLPRVIQQQCSRKAPLLCSGIAVKIRFNLPLLMTRGVKTLVTPCIVVPLRTFLEGAWKSAG
jgi:hypothetical protein